MAEEPVSSMALAIPIVAFAGVVLLVIIYQAGWSVGTVREPFDPPLYLAGPSKCFSCEASLPPQLAWMGRQTKCFDCERQLARQDPNLANLTNGTKCFACEGQIGEAHRRGCPAAQRQQYQQQQLQPHAQLCMDAGSGQCLF
jgi:hypothetical protein